MKKVIIVHLEIKQENRESFMKETFSVTSKSREETGCLEYNILENCYSENKFMIYEVYENNKAFENHKQSEHYKKYINLVMPILAKEPVIEIY
ncbi:putative quinol monooxygenase [uncultured Tenacibaculum sp.]|uniref:putative quinol monooxygenase n=1 Tax=uncultured Tenacibaculum sp. TaxID=174713 RepID=UPI00261CFC15|nr:putative quinol monooxygenase [uncultured Tenacibaculum sp.]